ncbi:MAG: AarF/UbiB family protein [Chloroflexia bacterium]
MPGNSTGQAHDRKTIKIQAGRNRKPRARASARARTGMSRIVSRVLIYRFSRHPDRYLEILRIIRKHKLHRVFSQLGLDLMDIENIDTAQERRSEQQNAESFADAVEELGPCFIKLGQLLSTRPDLLPPAYVEALQRLQNRVAPVPSKQIVRIIEEQLGAPISEKFGSFEMEPLAAASMAQVHRATLPEGTEVAVKVLRPGVKESIDRDIQVLHEMARFARRYTGFGARNDLEGMVRELETSVREDMDFRQTAANTRLISRQIAEFTRIGAPTIYDDWSAGQVLTMEFIHGRNLSKFTREEMRKFDSTAIARDLLGAYLKQIVLSGVFHADPHPGNVMLTEEGKLVMLDFGMVGRFDADEKDCIIKLLLAFAEREGARVTDIYLDMVELPPDFNRRAFAGAVSEFVSRYNDMTTGGGMGLGTAFLDLVRVAEQHQTPVPSALTLLSKTMLNLDGIVRALSPAFDPVELIRDFMVNAMGTRIDAERSAGQRFSWSLDVWNLVESAPRRADMILDRMANGQFTVNMNIDELDEASDRLTRAANRLSLSIVVGAAIVAAGYVFGNRRKQ